MKKKYIAPTSKMGCTIMGTSLLTASYSTEQAASDAPVYSRENSFWDDKE